MEIDLEALSDGQLNRHIAELQARAALAEARMKEALEEWRYRHGSAAGTRVEGMGVTVHLEARARWNAQQARQVLADRPDLLERIQVPALDRSLAKKILDEDTYRRCQKVQGTPSPRIVLEQGPEPA